MNILEFYPKLSDKKIPLSALEITPRVFHNWKEEKVIDYYEEIESNDIGVTGKTKKRKWVLLNAFDAIWLLIVKDLRKLKVDLNTIIKLKEYIYSTNPVKDFISSFNNEEFISFMETSTKSKENIQYDYSLIDIEAVLKFYDEHLKEIEKYTSNIATLFFTVLILEERPSIIISKQEDEVYFNILNKEGHIRQFGENDLFNILMTRLSNEYFINVPVIEPFIKLFKDKKLEQYCNHYQLFSENEKLILDIFREDNFKEINIFKDNNENLTITTTKSIEVKNEQAVELRKILGLKQYEKAEIVYRNDKHLVINRTNKTKISPD